MNFKTSLIALNMLKRVKIMKKNNQAQILQKWFKCKYYKKISNFQKQWNDWNNFTMRKL